jgi:hypothetical protein
VSWLEAELREQPAALERLLDRQAHRAQTGLPLVARVPEWLSALTR